MVAMAPYIVAINSSVRPIVWSINETNDPVASAYGNSLLDILWTAEQYGSDGSQFVFYRHLRKGHGRCGQQQGRFQRDRRHQQRLCRGGDDSNEVHLRWRGHLSTGFVEQHSAGCEEHRPDLR